MNRISDYNESLGRGHRDRFSPRTDRSTNLIGFVVTHFVIPIVLKDHSEEIDNPGAVFVFKLLGAKSDIASISENDQNFDKIVRQVHPNFIRQIPSRYRRHGQII